MQLVTSGSASGNYNAACRAAIFGREAVGHEPDFLNSLLRRGVSVVQSRVVAGVLAIEQDGAGIGAASADNRPRAGVAGVDNARREAQQGIGTAASGKLDDLRCTCYVSQRGAYLVDAQRIGGNRDLLVQAAGLQGGVDGRNLADEHLHISYPVRRKSRAFHQHGIPSRRKVGNLVVAVVGGLHRRSGASGLVCGSHLHPGHRCRRWVDDRSGDSALLHLCDAS